MTTRTKFGAVCVVVALVAIGAAFTLSNCSCGKSQPAVENPPQAQAQTVVAPPPAPVQTAVVPPPVVQTQPVEDPQAQMYVYAQPSAMGEGKTFHSGGSPRVDKAGIRVQVIENLVTEFGTQTMSVVVDANGRPIVCKPNQPAPTFAAGLQPGDTLATCKIDTAPPGRPATFTPVWVVVPQQQQPFRL
jgi:hypothetical protein